jgi:hypothetical protein
MGQLRPNQTPDQWAISGLFLLYRLMFCPVARRLYQKPQEVDPKRRFSGFRECL